MSWQDTENLRSRLRERRRNEERNKAAMEEERERAGEGRLERNRRWRQRKAELPASSASSSCSFKEDIQEEEKLSRRREPSERRQDEKEARREKNREWRMKRRQGEDAVGEKAPESKGPRLGELLHEVLACSCGKVSFVLLVDLHCGYLHQISTDPYILYATSVLDVLFAYFSTSGAWYNNLHRRSLSV